MSPIQVDDAQYDSNIHPYWKDRVVPRPGFRSPRALGPSPETNRIVIKDPKKSNEPNKQQLLPPRSYGKPAQTKKEIREKSPELNPPIVSE